MATTNPFLAYPIAVHTEAIVSAVFAVRNQNPHSQEAHGLHDALISNTLETVEQLRDSEPATAIESAIRQLALANCRAKVRS